MIFESTFQTVGYSKTLLGLDPHLHTCVLISSITIKRERKVNNHVSVTYRQPLIDNFDCTWISFHVTSAYSHVRAESYLHAPHQWMQRSQSEAAVRKVLLLWKGAAARALIKSYNLLAFIAV